MQVTTDDLFVLLLSVRFVSLFTVLSAACIHIQHFSYEYYSFFFYPIFFSLFSIISLLWVISHMLEQRGCEINEI